MLYRMFEKIIASWYLFALHFCKKFTILNLIINYNLSRYYLNLRFYFLAIMYFWWQYLIISVLMQSLIWYLSLKNIFLYLKYLQFISKFFFDFFFCLFILHIFRVKFPISFVRRSSRLTSRRKEKPKPCDDATRTRLLAPLYLSTTFCFYLHIYRPRRPYITVRCINYALCVQNVTADSARTAFYL